MSTDAVDRYLTRRDQGLRRQVVTPEGVPLGFTLARAGDRAAGFVLDMLIVYGAVIVLALLAWMAGGSRGAGWVMPFVLIAIFLLQNFYFVFFELRWQGMTPGKRVVGIRVMDARGGALTAGAVIARNLVRDVEVFVPLQVLVFSEQVFAGAPGWARLLASAWAVVFMLLPLFNKDRLRVGDMVAGTLVVLAPRAVLLDDLGGPGAAGSARDDYHFSQAQLGIYGIYELQVLEDLLRREAPTVAQTQALERVCEQIQRKIGWRATSPGAIDPERFLRAFYTALRAHLERKMLLGTRREDKFAPTSSGDRRALD